MAKIIKLTIFSLLIIIIAIGGCITQSPANKEETKSAVQNLTPTVVETTIIPDEVKGYTLDKDLWTGTYEKAKLNLGVGEFPPFGYVHSGAGFIKVNEGIDLGLISYMERNKGKERIHLFVLLNEHGPLNEGDETALKELGAGYFNIIWYHGIISAPNSAEALEKVVAHPKVFWLGEIKPIDKGLYNDKNILEWAFNADGTVNLVTTIHRDVSAEEVEELLKSYGTNVVRDGPTAATWTFTTNKEKISDLVKEDIVSYINEAQPLTD